MKNITNQFENTRDLKVVYKENIGHLTIEDDNAVLFEIWQTDGSLDKLHEIAQDTLNEINK